MHFNRDVRAAFLIFLGDVHVPSDKENCVISKDDCCHEFYLTPPYQTIRMKNVYDIIMLNLLGSDCHHAT